jgi:hypothetical protein
MFCRSDQRGCAGPRQWESLRTTGRIVGHDHFAVDHAASYGMEFDTDRAIHAWWKAAGTVVGLAEWASYANVVDLQDTGAGVCWCHRLCWAGSKDDLGRKGEARGRERHCG